MTGDANLEQAYVVIVGAGAAGLMAAIWAGRAAEGLTERNARIVALDGANKIGAKILVAGGGRCNVTHHAISERDYAASSRNAVRSVLRRWPVERTVEFFRDLGVHLKREDTGKLFPTTDRARTVLDALLTAARDAGAEIRHPARVETVTPADGGFVIRGDWGAVQAPRVIIAAGGKALPRSGSDGHGYKLVRALGHTVTERVFPSLVPLILDADSPLRALAGIAAPARLELRSAAGKRLLSFENATLCTHFGISGPGPMDISRYYTDARHADPGAHLVANWLPGLGRETADAELRALGRKAIAPWLRARLPDRLADTLIEIARVPHDRTGAELRKDERRALLQAIFEHRLPITGDRGFTHAETTAGGVPLAEVDLSTMHSRAHPNLHLCGEILDVDGRIGGFNFQWAWATGHLAGVAAAQSLESTPAPS